MGSILNVIISLVGLYKWVLIARILLTWFPAINWYNQPFRFMAQVTDPVMQPFRRLIPPIAGLDLSPILLFFALDLLQQALIRLVSPSIGMSF